MRPPQSEHEGVHSVAVLVEGDTCRRGTVGEDLRTIVVEVVVLVVVEVLVASSWKIMAASRSQTCR